MILRYKQWGQSMVEYTIVCAALITAFFIGANADCPGYDNCISKLLNVMHDNYDGYSSSISAVQKYGDYEAKGTPTDGSSSSGGGSDGGSGSGSGTTELNPDGLTDMSQVTSLDGYTTFGTLQPDGTVVDSDGNVIGIYSEASDTITLNNGTSYAAGVKEVVVDEEGNILHLRAVTDASDNVYSWGYVSKASGKVFNSLNQEELDISGYITQPSFKVVKNGTEQGGRILNGDYFAAVLAVDVSATAQVPTGEVIYWSDLNVCSVMVSGWDDDVDTSQSDANIYSDQLTLFSDDDKNLGQMDPVDYFEQTAIYGVPTEPNDCPSSRVISQP